MDITLYQGRSSKTQTTDSIKEKGLDVSFSKDPYWQDRGLFFTPCRRTAQRYAYKNTDFPANADEPRAYSILSEVTLSFNDVASQWDWDYEFCYKDVIKFLSNFREEIAALAPVGQLYYLDEETLLALNRLKNKGDEVGALLPSGMDISDIYDAKVVECNEARFVLRVSEYLGRCDGYKNLEIIFGTDGHNLEQSKLCSKTSRFLQLICNQIRKDYPEKYNDLFAQSFQKAVEKSENLANIACKYIGNQNLKPDKLYVCNPLGGWEPA